MSNSSQHEIIDIHNHFFNKNTLEAFRKLIPDRFAEQFAKANPERFKAFENLPGPEGRGEQMVQDMKLKQIDKILPMTFASDEESGFTIHKKFPNEFPGTVPMLQPDLTPDPEVLDSWKDQGAVAIKFYPARWKYGFDDERVGKYLDKIRDLGLGILIHFGVVKGGEMRGQWPAHPLELKPWLRSHKYEDMKFIVCHFGAGFLEDVLIMAYGYPKNIAVDTSGSNDWIFNTHWPDFEFVFKRSIEALKPENIYFGTDSNFQLLRKNVIDRQIGILEDLVTKKFITDEDRWNILGGNTRRDILKQT